MKKISRWTLALFVTAAGCVMLGCPGPEENESGDGTADVSPPEVSDGEPADAAGVDGEPIDVTGVSFTAKTAMIQFVGVHTDPEKPEPRTGTFESFTGVAGFKDGELQSVSVDIDTPSLNTEIADLTKHLKSGDFFNVNEYPTAKFVSTSIEDAGDGKVNITGDLTLLDETKSITFPATVSNDDGLQFDATFTIDRTEFGMDHGLDNIKKEVEMTVKIPK